MLHHRGAASPHRLNVGETWLSGRWLNALRLAAWGCVGLLALLSLLPGREIARTSLGGHVEHALAYAGTALLARLGYPEREPARGILALVLYAGLLEWLQRFAVGRSSAVEDWLASCLGVLIGIAVAHWVSALLKRSTYPSRDQ